MERTLILLKPDCVKRALCGEVIKRLENAELKIKGVKMIALTEAKVKEHYSQYVTAKFFPAIQSFMMSGPVMALVVDGPGAIKLVRKLCGATNSAEALPGTIRGDYANTIDANIIHASDSPETAAVEIPRFFSANEILQ